MFSFVSFEKILSSCKKLIKTAVSGIDLYNGSFYRVA